MRRFEVTVPEGTMRLYYESEEECRAAWPDALSICRCTDDNFKKSVAWIKECATNKVLTNRNEELWFFSLPIGEIVYKPYKNGGEYIDGCQYRFGDTFQLMASSLWTISNPEKFAERFGDEILRETPYLLSRNDAKRLGLRKIKQDFEGYRIFCDDDGNFYIVYKKNLPTKRQVEEYRNHACTDHLYVKYGRLCDWNYKWFDSVDDFNAFFRKYVSEADPSFQTPDFQIVVTGKTIRNPLNKRIILSVGKPPICYEDKEKNARAWAFTCRESVENWKELVNVFKYVMK